MKRNTQTIKAFANIKGKNTATKKKNNNIKLPRICLHSMFQWFLLGITLIIKSIGEIFVSVRYIGSRYSNIKDMGFLDNVSRYILV